MTSAQFGGQPIAVRVDNPRIEYLNHVQQRNDRIQLVGRERAVAIPVERVRYRNHPALIADAGNRLVRRQARRDPLLEEIGQHLAMGGADLLAHDHIDDPAVAGLESAPDLVVVGDREHVDPGVAGRLT